MSVEKEIKINIKYKIMKKLGWDYIRISRKDKIDIYLIIKRKENQTDIFAGTTRLYKAKMYKENFNKNI